MRLSQDCIFCRITNKISPAYIVDESENFICFFPEKPSIYGHTLISSKKHYNDIRDLPPALGSELLRTIQNIFKIYSEKLDATGFNLLNANGKSAEQSIDHLHFHFLPRFSNDGLTTWPELPPFEPDLNALFRLLNTGGNDES